MIGRRYSDCGWDILAGRILEDAVVRGELGLLRRRPRTIEIDVVGRFGCSFGYNFKVRYLDYR